MWTRTCFFCLVVFFELVSAQIRRETNQRNWKEKKIPTILEKFRFSLKNIHNS